MPKAYVSFILFFLIIVFGFGGAPVFSDPDTAWHIAAGDLIRQLHHIPVGDGWSFTAAGNVWYNLSWLFDLGLSLIFSHGGFSAVYAVTVVMFALSIAFMAWHSVKLGASPVAVLLLVLPVTFVVFTGTLARPNMCSLLMTVLFFHLLSELRDHGKILALILLPLLMILWVNLHGGFLFSFPLMGIFLLESVIQKNRRLILLYSLLIALCLAASLVNPYGYAVYYGAYRTLTAKFNATLIEWQPVAIGHNIQMTVMLLVVFVFSDFLDKRIAWSDRVTALFVLMMALSSFRHAIVAALLVMPYLALRITALMYGSRLGAYFCRWDNDIAVDMQKTDARLMAAAMTVAACVVVAMPHPRDDVLKEPARFQAERFPVGEANFVMIHYPDRHFFNSYNIGGYLDYIWRGRVKLFVDGRANSLYSDQLLKDYQDFTENHGFGLRSQMIAAYYKLDGLIIANDDKDSGVWNSNPDWKAVYRGKAATVYVRK